MNQKKNYAELLEEFSDLTTKYQQPKMDPYKIEFMFERLQDWSKYHSLNDVKKWFLKKRKNCQMKIKEIPLLEAKDWYLENKTGVIKHITGDFFEICSLRVEYKDRENRKGWEQPIIRQIGFDGGILGLIRQRFEGVPHYLCEAKAEPGNYGLVQISPTLQATFANINQKHGGRKPHFVDMFSNTNKYKKWQVLYEAWLSEDGGRLYNKRNKGLLLEAPEGAIIQLPSDNFIWLSLYQIKILLHEDSWINPHIRGILAHV